MSDISKLNALLPQSIGAESTPKSTPSQKQGETSFSDLLKSAINGVDSAQHEADAAIQQVLSGDSKNIHETMIALEKADVSLKLMLEVRNKILEAYQEVMRTQV